MFSWSYACFWDMQEDSSALWINLTLGETQFDPFKIRGRILQWGNIKLADGEEDNLKKLHEIISGFARNKEMRKKYLDLSEKSRSISSDLHTLQDSIQS